MAMASPTLTFSDNFTSPDLSWPTEPVDVEDFSPTVVPVITLHVQARTPTLYAGALPAADIVSFAVEQLESNISSMDDCPCNSKQICHQWKIV